MLEAQVVPTRAEPGCINYDFHVDADDQCVFVFYENWISQAALDAHMEMPHLRPLIAQLDRLLSKPIEIRYLRMISERRS
ncbi:Antibiotic biosynthesis monooxygenase [Rhizobium grahamii CCGE 502]|uniref:Antibiotic biosynthesis monooxygenase n=1 Tax=Rhizobium grahamii CCGE 502 TaxID=990285 RepID=S3HS73_9HYPH|nr:Antibiotic biosynthesis monooxygenase [Rhizobium grahamii CCGE 502]